MLLTPIRSHRAQADRVRHFFFKFFLLCPQKLVLNFEISLFPKSAKFDWLTAAVVSKVYRYLEKCTMETFLISLIFFENLMLHLQF